MHDCPRCGQACCCSGDIDDAYVLTEAWAYLNCKCDCEDDFYNDDDPHEEEGTPVDEQILQQLQHALTLLERTQQQLTAIEARFGPLEDIAPRLAELERKLEQGEPETAYQAEAAKLLGKSPRTLNRWRTEIPLIKGVHWWGDQNGRPIYNLKLIRDGQRQGFGSLPHQRACEQWVKAQPSEQKRRRAG